MPADHLRREPLQDLRLRASRRSSSVDLDIRRGEIFALLGPNGAGKTTLISIICGIVNAERRARSRSTATTSSRDYRAARADDRPRAAGADHRRVRDGVGDGHRSAAGCSASAPNPAHIEKVLRALSLWDKKDSKIMTLSGGMKRRVLIAKALSHEPRILFLDEPTAGVDVELRARHVGAGARLRETGVTIILTTHYIEEAEEMADRIGVISKGELILVEDKAELMRKLGKQAADAAAAAAAGRRFPPRLPRYRLELADDGAELVYTFDTQGERTGIAALLQRPRRGRHRLQGPADRRRARSRTSSSSLVKDRRMNIHAIRAIYRVRDGAHVPHADAEHRLAGAVDVAVLRRVRLGDRLAHQRDRRRQLRRLHRARPDHAVAADAEHLERVVRHLFPEVLRHDLRAAVGAGLRASRSCIGYVGAAATKSIILGAHHPRDRRAVRAAARSSTRSGWCCSSCSRR